MAKIVKYIPIYCNLDTTTSTSYENPNILTPFLWTPGNYDGTVTCYFEAVIKISVGTETMYTALYDGTSNIASSEVSTTSTGFVRVRSAAITLTADTEHRPLVKVSGGTGTILDARLVVVQEGTITKTETQICVSAGNPSTTNTSYVDISTAPLFLWDATQFDGTVEVFYEAVLSNATAGVIARSQLFEVGGAAVAGSEVSQTGASDTRRRSGALTLTDDAEHKAQYRTVTAGTVRVRFARLIVVQTGSPTKSESYNGTAPSATSTSTSGTLMERKFYWDNEEWSVDSKTSYFESTLQIDNAAQTATAELYDGAAADATVSTSSTTRSRQRSASFTPDDNTEYDIRMKTSNAANTATFRNGWIITQYTWSNAPGVSGDDWPAFQSRGFRSWRFS